MKYSYVHNIEPDSLDPEEGECQTTVKAMHRINVCFVLIVLTMAGFLSAFYGPISPMENQPPVADAGPDQTVNANEVVYFDGSGSYDPDGLLKIDPNMRVNDPVSGSQWQASPTMAVDDSGNVLVSWEDYRNGTFDIYFSRLLAGGTSFETDLRVNDDIGIARQSRPSLAIAPDGRIHLAWEDYRNNNWDIYYANSTDGGLSFASNVLISTENTTDWQNNPSIAVDSLGTVHAVWEDNRQGNWSIHYANSSDGYGRNVKVNDDLLVGNNWEASIGVGDTGVIHVIWETQSDIYHARSMDGGLTFNTTGRVNDDAGGASQSSASLAVEDGGNVHVVWEDSRLGDADIFYARSTDDGLTFEANIRINTDSSGEGQTSPWIAVEDSELVHVVWADARNSHWDIFYSVSFNGGISFQFNEKVNDDYLKAWQVRPTVAAEDGGYFHVAWKDARNKPTGLLYDVYYAKGKVSRLSYEWDFGDGSPPEAGITATHIYGLVGVYNVTLTVTDEQGAWDTDNCTITVELSQRPPIADANGPYYPDEGSEITLDASGSFDPDNGTLQYRWDLDNDGTWDTGWSASPYHDWTWGDDYTGEVVVEVWDGEFTDTDNASVLVSNVAPTISSFGPFSVDEATPITLTAMATDPGSDDLHFTWNFDYGPTFTSTHFNDGVGPDPYPSTSGIYPFTATDTVTHTYGDNGVFVVTLTLTDDDGGATTYATNITVGNVDPTIEVIEAYVYVSFTLRVAGEKWHNVEMYLYEEGAQIGYAEVVRYPGSPNDQSVTVADVKCDVTKAITARVLYTPDDDPINGQINGANPGWIILTFEDGSNATLNHTFNVMHPETWEWNVRINQHFVGHEITFEAKATDPGSDDLQFIWAWGDGTPDDDAKYYNDGTGPDPYPSPDVNPITATDVQKHTYMTVRTYTMLLTVEDDDGGAVTTTLDLNF